MMGRFVIVYTGLLIFGYQQVYAAVREARCVIDQTYTDGSQKLSGVIRLRQVDDKDVVLGLDIKGFSTVDSSIKHGFHIHEKGDVSESCSNVGSHFNPLMKDHGAPNTEESHVGDLGNIVEDEQGVIQQVISANRISLGHMPGRYDVVDRSLVIHANMDDLGQGGVEASLKTGNAGAKIACCTIVAVEENDLTTAMCAMTEKTGSDDNQDIRGTIEIKQLREGGMTTYDVDLRGFNGNDEETVHGFHIHEKGSTGNGCKDAGPHYNPLDVSHGAPDNRLSNRHVGDLGNVAESNKAIATVIHDPSSSLIGLYSIIGRAIVVHATMDDLGTKNNTGSKATGNAGARIACCVIQYNEAVMGQVVQAAATALTPRTALLLALATTVAYLFSWQK